MLASPGQQSLADATGTAMHCLALVTAAVVVMTAGDYLLKLASLRDDAFTSVPFVLGSALYAVSAIGWLVAMRQMNLASLGAVTAVVSVALLALLGAACFGERLSTRELAGLGLAGIALMLLSRPA
jgi:small multidrug resistance pump